jgi:hypothetical protein
MYSIRLQVIQPSRSPFQPVSNVCVCVCVCVVVVVWFLRSCFCVCLCKAFVMNNDGTLSAAYTSSSYAKTTIEPLKAYPERQYPNSARRNPLDSLQAKPLSACVFGVYTF